MAGPHHHGVCSTSRVGRATTCPGYSAFLDRRWSLLDHRLDPDYLGPTNCSRVADPPMTGQHATRRSLSLSLGPLDFETGRGGLVCASFRATAIFHRPTSAYLLSLVLGHRVDSRRSPVGVAFLRSRYFATSGQLRSASGCGEWHSVLPREASSVFWVASRWVLLLLVALGLAALQVDLWRAVDLPTLVRCDCSKVQEVGSIVDGHRGRDRLGRMGHHGVDRVRRCQPARRHARILRTFARKSWTAGPSSSRSLSAGCACWVVRSFCTRCTWRLARLPGTPHDGRWCLRRHAGVAHRRAGERPS